MQTELIGVMEAADGAMEDRERAPGQRGEVEGQGERRETCRRKPVVILTMGKSFDRGKIYI